jgi:hypothetical protein
MTTLPEPTLPWTDHYVKYGFAVVRGILDRDYIAEALEEVKRLVGTTLPFEQWTVSNIPKEVWNQRGGPNTPVLNRIYDQPRVRAAIDEMFGSPDEFNNDRHFQLFVKPYDPAAKKNLVHRGHIDFVESPVPVFGSGFMFQVSLVDKESFGGNITIWPGTHKLVQKHVMDDPGWQFPKNWGDIPEAEPFEFVPRAGDALFFHHLVGHEGNPCCTRMPRISLHCQGLRDAWLEESDPGKPNMSPWERSLALNGRFKTRRDEKKMMLDYFASKKNLDKKAKQAEQYR